MRTSAAEAACLGGGDGTAEAVPFVFVEVRAERRFPSGMTTRERRPLRGKRTSAAEAVPLPCVAEVWAERDFLRE